MNEKPVKVDIGFQEALRRIAHTPKSVVDKVVSDEKRVYNDKEATEKPPPANRKTS